MPRTRALVPLLAVLLASTVGAAACTSKKTPAADLPAGGELLSASSTAMAAVKNAHVTIDVQGTIANLPLRRADAVLTQSGDAKGTIQLEQFGALVELTFVLVNKTVHLKGLTGAWQTLPLAQAATFYDPSAILDVDRGVPHILATAKDAKTEARETVDGHDTYRVAASFDAAALKQVMPGVGDGVTGKIWVDAQNKLLRKAVFTVPGAAGAAGGTVTITAADYDASVTISAP